MRLLDISFISPGKNLALDEVLLEGAEHGRDGECLRFWESPTHFVVLGIAQAVRAEIHLKACEQDDVPIMRRCSGGGCVLQGPGCLNFALVLGHESRPELRTIRESYCYVLGRIREAFLKRDITLRHNGISDLTLGGRKISGNAQKRRKHFILHHGTLLYRLDPALMERYQREPLDRPRYRGDRTHRGFVRNLPLDARDLRHVILDAFEVDVPTSEPSAHQLERAHELAHEKYYAHDWTFRR
ncbi:MAG TPA: biotin/lipoate A/B protein ligase family protein [Candidatus Hydrogenedentes bacterium]|nr:biotin/lipoate A/B protein ligase family protein [Candidatus Hydrogenedentota bacterium]HPG69571.1 biotin/lipoate A/B protein ligase family protein [Candidatus Hydrogenedentota bacterium]